MQPSPSSPWWKNCRWTLALCAAMAVANLGLFPAAPDAFGRWIHWLQFDRQAIAQGELWRLVTGNLVHWSVEHFLLDCGVFFVVGWLYERHLGRSYAWILLASGLAVGCGIFVFLPEMEIYRGLSGVDSGQFAAAVGIEFHLARRQPRRWVWVAPVAAIFVLKILYECASGQMFFGTESLGNIGLPTPLAHAAGALAAAIVLAAPYATLPPFRPYPGKLVTRRGLLKLLSQRWFSILLNSAKGTRPHPASAAAHVRAPLDAYGSTSETTERHIFQRGHCVVTFVSSPQLGLRPLVNETEIAPIVVATGLSGDNVVVCDFGGIVSPPHTCRIQVLLELFPKARFIHTYRDPYAVFPSTLHLWKRHYRDQGLQTPKYVDLEEQVFDTFNHMYEVFERDRELIAPGRLSEVSYEALVADPASQLRRIYEELELGEFDEVLPALEQYVADQADYKTNRYVISPETRAEVTRRWSSFIHKYGYTPVPT